MADEVFFKFKGADDLSAKFKRMSEAARREIVLPAAKDAMEIVLIDAKERADRIDDPATPNYIPNNLKLAEQDSAEGSIRVAVGMKKARRGSKGGNTFYWQWVELGTQYQAPQPFLRNALNQNKEAVFKEFISSAKFQLLKVAEE